MRHLELMRFLFVSSVATTSPEVGATSLALPSESSPTETPKCNKLFGVLQSRTTPVALASLKHEQQQSHGLGP